MSELETRLNQGDKLSDEDKEALKIQLESYVKSL